MRRCARRASMVLSATLVIAALGGRARAQVDVMVSPEGAEFARQSGINLGQLEMQLEDELRGVFQTTQLGTYLQNFSDAQSFATRGMGVDYASNGNLVIGVAGNVSLNVEDGFEPENINTRPAVEGVATNLTFMAGVNLGLIGLEPVTIFGNYFQRGGSLGEFDAEMRNWGLHLQIKLFGPGKERMHNAIVRWGGFDITTGVDYASLGLTLGRNLKRDIPLGASGARVGFDGMGSFTLNTDTLTIPLELTTNLRLLYIVSIYGGLGFDWQLGGKSELEVNMNGGLTGRVAGQSNTVNVGTATVAAVDSAEPSAGRLRMLLGAQVNVLFFKLFTQLNLIPDDPALASVALGARVVF